MSSKRLSAVFLFAGLMFFSELLICADAEALPLFARRIGRKCTFCHSVFPKLNETGRVFRSNGFRFADEGEWKDVKSLKSIPLAMEIEVEGAYDKIKSGGTETESSDMKIEEVEVFTAGAIGRSGRVSFLGVVGVEENVKSNGSSEYETVISEAFIQINDLVGPVGEGRVNLRVGQWELALPFLGHGQRLVKNRYMLESALGVFTPAQKAVELNGSLNLPGDQPLAAHRYSIGAAREETFDDNRFKGYYATYNVTVNEVFSLGAIFRGGEEKSGSTDRSFRKYGFAGEIEAGPVIVGLGFFRAEREDSDNLNNYLVEVIYMPFKRTILGARFDAVRVKGRDKARSLSVMARYNILSSVFALVEYRNLTDDDHVTGSNEDENKVRLFIVALI